MGNKDNGGMSLHATAVTTASKKGCFQEERAEGTVSLRTILVSPYPGTQLREWDD